MTDPFGRASKDTPRPSRRPREQALRIARELRARHISTEAAERAQSLMRNLQAKSSEPGSPPSQSTAADPMLEALRLREGIQSPAPEKRAPSLRLSTLIDNYIAILRRNRGGLAS